MDITGAHAFVLFMKARLRILNFSLSDRTLGFYDA